MKMKPKQIATGVMILSFLLCFSDRADAYGYNFVFPSNRRSVVSGFTYADPVNPGHLAWDYRFSMHTLVTSAQKGWILSLL